MHERQTVPLPESQEESIDSSFFIRKEFFVYESLIEAVKYISDARAVHGDRVLVEIPGAEDRDYSRVVVRTPYNLK